MTQKLVTIFGGDGFVGTNLIEQLAKQGFRIRAAVRRPNSALHLKPLGEVGQIQIVQANIRDEQSVRAAIHGACFVVNLVGILTESGAQKFQAIHEKGAETVARICREQAVEKLIHMSALGACEGSPARYGQSKARGEKAVKAIFPEATILRPSVIFGPGDQLFNAFARAACLSPVLPVFSGDTRFQPVYVGDVAAAMVRILTGPDKAGETFELGGADTYSLREMMKLAAQHARQKVCFIDVPAAVSPVMVFFMGLLPQPPITLDQLKMLRQDNVVSGTAPGLAELGILPALLDIILPEYMMPYRPKGQFSTHSGD